MEDWFSMARSGALKLFLSYTDSAQKNTSPFEIIANAKILLAKQTFLLLESDVTQGFTHEVFTCTMAALGLGITLKNLPQAVQVPVHFESFENTCNSRNTLYYENR